MDGGKGRAFLFAQAREPAAAHGLHHPHRDIALAQKRAFFLALLQRPVHIIELNLAKFHLIAVQIQEFAQIFQTSMAGKAQMPDAPAPLLLHKILDDAPTGIQIGGQGIFAHVVQQIEIKILHAALLQLPLEYRGRIVRFADLMAGILAGKQERFPRMLFQAAPEDQFRFAIVIGIRGIKVIHAVFQRVVHHLFRLRLVHLAGAIAQKRKPHGPKAEQGNPFPLKIAVSHGNSPFFSRYSTNFSIAGESGGSRTCPSRRKI